MLREEQIELRRQGTKAGRYRIENLGKKQGEEAVPRRVNGVAIFPAVTSGGFWPF